MLRLIILITIINIATNWYKARFTPIVRISYPKWYVYNNTELGIISASDQGVRHNAITPILRRLPASDNIYCLYLILRNNRTSDEQHPEGIFHPSS